MLNKILLNFGLSEDDVITYVFLLEHGEQTAGPLSEKLGFPRASLYGFLRRLIDVGLVIESVKNNVKIFKASPLDKINQILDQKMEAIKDDQRNFQKILPQIICGHGSNRQPKFQLFEGKESVRNVIKDTLLYKNLETESYWPIKSMLKILGPDFFRYFNKERIRRNIFIRAIWPKDQVVNIKKYPFLGTGDTFLREIRVLPDKIDFDMGYWIYDNKVSFISSEKESYGFIIDSSEFSKMMRSQFNLIWSISTKLNINPDDTAEFESSLSE